MARNINLDIPLEDIPQLDFDELYKLYIELFSLPTKAPVSPFLSGVSQTDCKNCALAD